MMEFLKDRMTDQRAAFEVGKYESLSTEVAQATRKFVVELAVQSVTIDGEGPVWSPNWSEEKNNRDRYAEILGDLSRKERIEVVDIGREIVLGLANIIYE